MAKESFFNDREQELVAVGASIAAGCIPCARFHFRAARIAGASREEIRKSVDQALRVRRSATQIMGQLDSDSPHRPVEEQAAFDDGISPLAALISISAAFALNCTTNLEAYIVIARQQEVTDGQILTAIKIACAVKSMAGRKVQAAAARALGATEEESDACECDEQEVRHAQAAEPARAGQASAGCSSDCSCKN